MKKSDKGLKANKRTFKKRQTIRKAKNKRLQRPANQKVICKISPFTPLPHEAPCLACFQKLIRKPKHILIRACRDRITGRVFFEVMYQKIFAAKM